MLLLADVARLVRIKQFACELGRFVVTSHGWLVHKRGLVLMRRENAAVALARCECLPVRLSLHGAHMTWRRPIHS